MSTKNTAMKKPKANWRSKISLTAYLSGIGAFALIVGVISISISSYKILENSKFEDTWAISYIEMENQTRKIYDKLAKFERKISFSSKGLNQVQYNIKPDAKYFIDIDRTVKVEFGQKLTARNINLTDFNLLKSADDIFLTNIQGQVFLVKKDEFLKKKPFNLYFWKIDPAKELEVSQFEKNDSIVYITNFQGQVMYSNRMEINSNSVMQRNLVHKFVKSSLVKGQIEFRDGGESFSGFYAIVANSNLVLFSEMSNKIILEKIRNVSKIYVLISIIIVILTVFLLFLTLRKITVPIRELMNNIILVSTGEFNKISPIKNSFGELNYLSEAFMKMVFGLINRDRAISKLQEEEKEKIRLEKDMMIAQEIQLNLLPQESQERDGFIKFNYRYHAATEVAGDWVGHFYDEKNQDTVIVIADVSGHGAGSSMFTAMTAAIFEQVRISAEKFDAFRFITELHHTVKTIGKNKWHITLQLFHYEKTSNKCKVYNAGHLFPLIYDLQKKKIKSLVMPSSPICIGDSPNIFSTELSLENESLIVLYTDGLVEALNVEGKPYKAQKVRKLIQDLDSDQTGKVLDNILFKWREFTQGVPQNDDLCIVAFKLPRTAS